MYEKPSTFDAAEVSLLQPEKVDGNTSRIGNNYLTRIDSGMYVLYVEGDAATRGNVMGALTRELHLQQEAYFIAQIRKMIPDEYYLRFLKYFTSWFTRDIEKFIPHEYLEEIYHESVYMHNKYDDLIGPPYMRLLNYHAAHDIGHALQDKNFVAGCTSFAAWNNYSADGKLITGRNFDFYVGDDFARNKIVCFMKPDKGIPFAMITWPGMIGAVSGVNNAGISVTINAAKSSVPGEAKTPVSIVCREILQYAGSIADAYRIAATRDMFVSESIMVSSGKENRSVLIEKSPDTLALFAADSSLLICSNHFRSELFRQDKNNNEFRVNSSSQYRFERLQELVNLAGQIDVTKAVSILRDPYGKNGAKIGWGNEKALNQLIAHHSIVMRPGVPEFWVSTQPWQLGRYLHFDLNKLFLKNEFPLVTEKTIPADTALLNTAYPAYMEYKSLRQKIRDRKKLSAQEIQRLLALNPDYYESAELAGDQAMQENDQTGAASYYKLALQKILPVKQDSLRIVEKLKKIK